jgi:CHAD domain-containing protein
VAEARRGPLEDAVAALASPRASRVVLALGAWLEDGGWHARAEADTRALLDRPMTESSGVWLTALHAKARRVEKAVDQGSPKAREKLRRRLRRLAYAADFFRGLYPATATRPFLAALDPVLSALDALHDADTGRRLLATLAAADPALRASIDKATRRLDRNADAHRKALPDLWRAFRDTPGFWG